MKKKFPSVNLLKGKKKQSLDTFINWALTAGRIIIITTEAIALGAFLYRFVLDKELGDLHDRIIKKQAIVALYKSDEEKFRNLQERLGLASSLMAKSPEIVTLSEEIFALLPSDAQVKNISFDANTIGIKASVPTVDSLRTLIDALKTYPKITSVSIDQIDNKTSLATIDVSITTTLKQQENITNIEGQ